jgi:Mrp family chromosome partitioning ATPase
LDSRGTSARYSEQQPGFRSQQRFSDPSQAIPPEWTAPTPPHGIPVVELPTPTPTPEPAQPEAQPPYLDLSTVALLGQPKKKPSAGWRRWLYLGSFTLVNLGEGRKAMRRKELTAQATRPLRECYRIALLSLKGGVGKTTITATLGATFASARGDRVIAVDANPDRGTLSQKVPLETPSTVRHLLRDAEGISSYSDVAGSEPSGSACLRE